MITKTKKTRLRRCAIAELKKVGVHLFDETNIRLACKKCGREWSPNVRQDGHLPRGYW